MNITPGELKSIQHVSNLELKSIQHVSNIANSIERLSNLVESYQYKEIIDVTKDSEKDSGLKKGQTRVSGHAYKVTCVGKIAFVYRESFDCILDKKENIILDSLEREHLDDFYNAFTMHYIDDSTLDAFRSKQITEVAFINTIKDSNRLFVLDRKGDECLLDERDFNFEFFEIDYTASYASKLQSQLSKLNYINYTLSVENGPDLKFKGNRIDYVLSNGFNRNARRWTQLSVYRTINNVYIAYSLGVSIREGENDKGKYKFCKNYKEIKEFFGDTELSKKLYYNLDKHFNS